ncbi:MAG: HDOD domain-containing protein, partial [Fimbriimonadales bacterium]
THIVARLRRADGCPWDREQTAQSLLPALAEEADELRQAIGRASRLREVLGSNELRALVSNIGSMPTLPANYHRLLRELDQQDPSIARVSEIIEQDIGMTAKVLQMVNSAFFGAPRHVSSARDAAALLGLDTLRALVTAVHVFRQFPQERVRDLNVDTLHQDGLTTGSIARRIAQEEGLGAVLASQALLAGMLHDIGRVLMACVLPERYRQCVQAARNQGGFPWEAEYSVLGVSHAELGAYLLGLWAFPQDTVEAVAYHHRPENGAENASPLVPIVHFSDCLERAVALGIDLGQAGFASEHMERIGLANKIGRWTEIGNKVLGDRWAEAS